MTIKIRYKILKHFDEDALAAEVQCRLNEGWELCGGMTAAATNSRNGTLIIVKYQALTKTEERVKEVEEEDWDEDDEYLDDEP